MGVIAERTISIPEYLTEGRMMAETSMIGLLFSNFEYYSEFSCLNDNDFCIEETLFLFKMGHTLFKNQFKKFDAIGYANFVQKNPNYETYIDQKLGGLKGIQNLIGLVDEENKYAIYDEMIKLNMVGSYAKAGVVLTESKWNEIKYQNTEYVKNYFDNISSKAFQKMRTGSAKPIDLTNKEDLQEYLIRADKGANLGIPLDDHYLNQVLAGLHNGNILAHCAHSGIGKTTSSLALYILPLIKRGVKVVILANEQSVDEFRNMLLPTIISMQLEETKWVNRKTLMKGGFDDDHWESLQKAVDWISQYKDLLIFHPIESFKGTSICNIIKEYDKNCQEYTENGDKKLAFLFDTFKPSSEGGSDEGQAWQIFSEDAKEIHKTIKDKSVGGLGLIMIFTMQLAGGTANRRYLNVECLAKSKSVKEVLSQVTLIRKLRQDECNAERSDCKPFKWQKNESTGKYEKVNLVIENPQEYFVCFIDKNRFGEADVQYIIKANQGINKWEFIGQCYIVQDY